MIKPMIPSDRSAPTVHFRCFCTRESTSEHRTNSETQSQHRGLAEPQRCPPHFCRAESVLQLSPTKRKLRSEWVLFCIRFRWKPRRTLQRWAESHREREGRSKASRSSSAERRRWPISPKVFWSALRRRISQWQPGWPSLTFWAKMIACAECSWWRRAAQWWWVPHSAKTEGFTAKSRRSPSETDDYSILV